MIRAAAFDFDGVILESADIKTRAFRRLFEHHPEHVEAIVQYHLDNAGVSRFEKFRVIHGEMLGLPLSEDDESALGDRFSALVLEEVLRCPFVDGARELLERRSQELPCFVASGTPEGELRHIVEQRALSDFFTGVYGTPPKKHEILGRVAEELGCRCDEILFVGDAMTDLDGARGAGTRFVGRVGVGQPDVFAGEGVPVVRDLAELDREWEALAAAPVAA